jgi:CRP/FNR family transcriptional regulator, polysaccharide utilization system transcription regulator
MQYINPYIEFCLEGTSSIFKGLNQKEKETIAQQHTLYHIKKGDLLFKAGDKHRGLICLASGKVKVFKDGVGGREQILKLVKQQGFIGYRSLFSEHSWTVSAEAIEDSVICVFDKSSFVKILKKNPDLGLRFIRVLSEELAYSNNRTVSLTQKHIRGRMAESLLIMRDTYGYDEDTDTIRVSLSREDIAGLSNMTTSNAIRTLANLAAEGSIAIKGKKITILDAKSLEHISELG